jgi:hypothetical protein
METKNEVAVFAFLYKSNLFRKMTFKALVLSDSMEGAERALFDSQPGEEITIIKGEKVDSVCSYWGFVIDRKAHRGEMGKILMSLLEEPKE